LLIISGISTFTLISKRLVRYIILKRSCELPNVLMVWKSDYIFSILLRIWSISMSVSAQRHIRWARSVIWILLIAVVSVLILLHYFLYWIYSHSYFSKYRIHRLLQFSFLLELIRLSYIKLRHIHPQRVIDTLSILISWFLHLSHGISWWVEHRALHIVLLHWCYWLHLLLLVQVVARWIFWRLYWIFR
jgi:heme/copper-type cytochrome/quinol oxidase subunit 4